MRRELSRRELLELGLGLSGVLLAGCSGNPVAEQKRPIPEQWASELAKVRGVKTYGIDPDILQVIDRMRVLTFDLLHNANTLHFVKGGRFRAFYPFQSEGYQCVASYGVDLSNPGVMRANLLDPVPDGAIFSGIAMSGYTPGSGAPKNYEVQSNLLSKATLEDYIPLINSGNHAVHKATQVLMLRLFKGGTFDEEMAEKIRRYCRSGTVQLEELPAA